MDSDQFSHPGRYLSCSSETELWDWMTSLLKAEVLPITLPSGYLMLILYWIHIVQSVSQNDDLRPPVMRHHSDIVKQKFGTMPLVPIRGEENNTNSTMLSANQTLVSTPV